MIKGHCATNVLTHHFCISKFGNLFSLLVGKYNLTLSCRDSLHTEHAGSTATSHIPADKPADNSANGALRKKDDIVIKVSDKCKGLIILDKSDYVNKSKVILDDEINYSRLDQDKTAKIEAATKRIFKHRFERQALERLDLKPDFLVRYIDDYAGVWIHGKEALLAFVSYLNGIDDKIKFTCEMSGEGVGAVPMLDTLITLHSAL